MSRYVHMHFANTANCIFSSIGVPHSETNAWFRRLLPRIASTAVVELHLAVVDVMRPALVAYGHMHHVVVSEFDTTATRGLITTVRTPLRYADRDLGLRSHS